MNRGADKSELEAVVSSVCGRGRSRDPVDVLLPAPDAGCAASSSLSLSAIAMSSGTGDFVSFYHLRRLVTKNSYSPRLYDASVVEPRGHGNLGILHLSMYAVRTREGDVQ